jgi:hypothetical protein
MSGDLTLSDYFDPSIPSPARIYDYYLNGKDNFAADRAVAERALLAVPQGRDVAVSNRGFLVRAVRYMARQGITQFIDLGTGFPTSPSVYETAAAIVDEPRVVYIDNDPMVTSHNRALLASDRDQIAVIHGDIRNPGQIFKQDALWDKMDFDQPVGVLFVAVLHFIPAEDDPYESVRVFRSHMAPGSCLVISHITSGGTAPAVMAAIRAAYRTATAPAVFRSREEVEAFFAGLDVVYPGITDISPWRGRRNQPTALRVLGGIGRKQ